MLYASMCYKVLNQPELAKKLSQNALQLNSSNPDTHYLLSKIDEKNSLAHLKQTTSLNPLYVKAWLDLAYKSIKQHNYSDAERYLLPVKYIDSKNYKIFYYQGLVEKYRKNDELAIEFFQKTLNLNPEFEPALNELRSLSEFQEVRSEI